MATGRRRGRAIIYIALILALLVVLLAVLLRLIHSPVMVDPLQPRTIPSPNQLQPRCKT